MFRDREEELRRLEEELLAQEEYEEEIGDEEYDDENDFDEDDFDQEYEEEEEAPAQTVRKQNYRIYNGDKKLDVDLEAFSEDVRAGRRRSLLPWVFILLTAALLLLGYLYLKQGGYLP